MSTCELKPSDKRAFIGAVGEDLVKRHGKKKYYNTGDIGRTVAELGYSIDWACWAYCIYASPEDFKTLHDAAGEACDYAAMKSEVLTDLAGGAFQGTDIGLSWLEWPDIDLWSLFDWSP